MSRRRAKENLNDGGEASRNKKRKMKYKILIRVSAKKKNNNKKKGVIAFIEGTHELGL